MKRDPEMTIDELWDKYLRAHATIDNMQKAHRKELTRAREEGVDSALREILPIVDSLDAGNRQAAQYRGRGGAVSNLKEGFNVVAKQARSTLDSLGVNPFDCEHQAFDPARMDAIAQLPTTELEPGRVTGEIRRGYTIKSRLLRPAQVAVSVEPEKEKIA